MENPEREIKRLRDRICELEVLERRVEFVEAMARRLQEQADVLSGSVGWRMLASVQRMRCSITHRIHGRTALRGITTERYWQWLADCEKREPRVPERGPCFGVSAQDDRTLASLNTQTYPNWRADGNGDYILHPGRGGEFGPDTLARFAEAVEDGADVVYCDEDHLDNRGLRVDPWFKPDWSPDLLSATNYIGQAFAARRELGGGTAQEICGRAKGIVHVPRVLYHGRESGRDPVTRVRHPVPAGSHVEIVVDSREPQMLERCLASVRSTTDYADYDLAVVDCAQGDGIAAVAARYGARCIACREPRHSRSAMYKIAAPGSPTSLLLFLHDDVTPTEAGWLTAMVEHGARPEVGVVGAKLLDSNLRILHAGFVMGIYGLFGSVFHGLPASQPTYQRLAETVRNVSAVSGACMLVRTDVLRSVGAFDEATASSSCDDVDLCLRVLDKGKRVIYTPYAVLLRRRSQSERCPRDLGPSGIPAFQCRWRKYIDHDPFYNPNLTRAAEDYGLRSPEEYR